MFPDAEEGEPTLAVLMVTSGGLTGGDAIRIRVGVEAGATAMVTSQAAEKLYRSLGADTRITIDLSVATDGWLEYLPQETILFNNARLDRRTRVDLADDARLLACEMLVFGRTAHDEQFASGRLFDRWQIWRGEHLLWADAITLDGDIAAMLASPFGFAGATALATVVYVGDDAEEILPGARENAEAAKRGGVSLIGGVLVARFFDPSAQVVRDALGRYLIHLRQATGHKAALPRIWHT